MVKVLAAVLFVLLAVVEIFGAELRSPLWCTTPRGLLEGVACLATDVAFRGVVAAMLLCVLLAWWLFPSSMKPGRS